MRKLGALTDFLITSLVIERENIASSVLEGESLSMFSPENIDLGFTAKYTGAVRIMNYSKTAENILFLVENWLQKYDKTRSKKSLATPKFEIDILDNKTVDVLLNIEFIDDIDFIEVETETEDSIKINDKYYVLKDSEVYPAPLPFEGATGKSKV